MDWRVGTARLGWVLAGVYWCFAGFFIWIVTGSDGSQFPVVAGLALVGFAFVGGIYLGLRWALLGLLRQ